MDALQKALTEGMDTAELQQLRDTLSVRPDDPQAYYHLGNALVKRQKFAEAEASCPFAVRLPRSPRQAGLRFVEVGEERRRGGRVSRGATVAARRPRRRPSQAGGRPALLQPQKVVPAANSARERDTGERQTLRRLSALLQRGRILHSPLGGSDLQFVAWVGATCARWAHPVSCLGEFDLSAQPRFLARMTSAFFR